MRWLGVNHWDELDRDAIIGLGKDDRRSVGKANLCGARSNLLDRIGRALATRDRDIEARGFVVALVERDVIIGMSTVESEVGDKSHAVRGNGGLTPCKPQYRPDDRDSREDVVIGHLCTLLAH